MKKAIVCTAMLLALAGCKSDGNPPSNPDTGKWHQFIEVTHKLNDGRTVTCLLWDQGGGYDSGMSCDWARAEVK